MIYSSFFIKKHNVGPVLTSLVSGSPVIQNGKLVGAVTHDPTRGYGIFIENMLAETEKIK